MSALTVTAAAAATATTAAAFFLIFVNAVNGSGNNEEQDSSENIGSHGVTYTVRPCALPARLLWANLFGLKRK